MWTTKSGTFTTTRKCRINFTIPSLHKHREITWNCYIDDRHSSTSPYDLIIGRDLMHEIGIDIRFSTAEITWDKASIPMQPPHKFENMDKFEQELLFMEDPVTTDAERIQNIVENKYCPADLNKIAHDCNLLSDLEKQTLYKLLKKFEHLFDGTLFRQLEYRPY